MLSDSVMALAVGCDSKWLYNAARRSRRPLGRTASDALWWRLVHHLANGIGASVANAVKGADALWSISPDAGRVRIGASRDESVAVSVDLSRFHDSAALAIAAAIYRAVPKRRGRPRKRPLRVSSALHPTVADTSPTISSPARLERALGSVTGASDQAAATDPRQIVGSMFDQGLAVVLVGNTAAVFHGMAAKARSLDLVASAIGARAGTLADILNRIQAVPRGVEIREAFRFDSALIRSVDVLALRIGPVSVNISQSLSPIGEFQQVRDAADSVEMGGRSYLVLRADKLQLARR